MPNPNGANQFDRFEGTTPYGDKQRQKMLTAAAPMPKAPAVNAPSRARERAVRPEPIAPPPPPTEVRPEVLNAGIWRALIESDPVFRDPFFLMFADEAERRAAG